MRLCANRYTEDSMLRTAHATRYVLPLREGGSLPAIVEADDLGLYVAKFRGAGQGPLALVAELVAGEIARTLGLRVPEIIFIEIDVALSRNEPDYEIRHLLKASAGLNLALDYLPGSTMFDPAARDAALSGGSVSGCLARRLYAERRPYGAQRQPTAVAPEALPHRPWSCPLFSPQLGHDAGESQLSLHGNRPPCALALGDRDPGSCHGRARETQP